jgi:hypothetical protein
MIALSLRSRTRGPRDGTGWRRARWARMLGHSILWSGLGTVALAVGVGVQLGESAVNQIDPLYFQGPAIHPRDRGAALDPATLPGPIVSPYQQAYSWARGAEALAAYHGEVAYPYALNPEPAVQQLAETQWAVVETPQAQPWPVVHAGANPEIERYARYPIEDKPSVEREPETDEQPRAVVRMAAQPAESLSTAPVLVYDE